MKPHCIEEYPALCRNEEARGDIAMRSFGGVMFRSASDHDLPPSRAEPIARGQSFLQRFDLSYNMIIVKQLGRRSSSGTGDAQWD